MIIAALGTARLQKLLHLVADGLVHFLFNGLSEFPKEGGFLL
jgi:hypothetical protein